MSEKMHTLAGYGEWIAAAVIFLGLIAAIVGLVEDSTGLNRKGLTVSCSGALLYILCVLIK